MKSDEGSDSKRRNGGIARAQKLSPEQRREIASNAASRRWADRRSNLPRATHMGSLVIGEIVIPCAVLGDGRRLLTQEGIATALGRAAKPARSVSDSSSEIPYFIDANRLKPFIPNEFSVPANPVEFLTLPSGASLGQRAFGFRAEILPDVCAVYVDAHDAKALTPQQSHIYERAKVLLRSFARVGIIALVDEATGYQADRERDELQRILAAYIRPEMAKWTGKFPAEFFKQVYKLHNWKYTVGDTQGPRYVGKFINKFIYDKLPPGVIDEIQKKNPRVEGRRKHKNYNFLTEHTGIPHLDRQIEDVVLVMRLADTKGQFQRLFDRAFPSKGQMDLIHDPIDQTKMLPTPSDDAEE